LKVAAPTGYFGVLTSAALAAWQASVGLPSTGFFGPLSRAAIGNGVSTGGGSGTTGSSGGGNGGSSSGILPLPPTIAITFPENNSNVGNTLTVSGVASDIAGITSVTLSVDGGASTPVSGTVSWTYLLDTTTLVNGAHTITVQLTDPVGNLATASIVVLVNNGTVTGGGTGGGNPNPDTTPPSTPTGVLVTATATSTVSLSWNSSTDNVGVAGYEIFRNGVEVGTAFTNAYTDINLSPATGFSYTILAYDAAGNLSAQSTPVIGTTLALPDTTPPTITMTAPPNNSIASGTVIVSANASDNVGVASVQFLLDGIVLGVPITVPPYLVHWNTVTATTGTHLLAAVAADAAGNLKTATALTVTVTRGAPDTTPPSVPTNLTATGISTSQINLAWTASTDNVGVAGYNIFRGGVLIASTTTNSYSNTGLAASTTYSYAVSAYDAAGNTSAQSSPATGSTLAAPDTTPPTVTMTAPPNNSTASGTVIVSATASDNVGVASVQFLLDGVPLGPLLTTSPYQIFWNTLSATNGTHLLAAVAADAAGNMKTSAAITVTVVPPSDTTPPSVPTNLTATAVSFSQINLAWTASTDNVGVAGYKVFRGGTQIATTSVNSYSNTGLSSSTTYTYTVAAYDAVGNASAQSASASATTPAAPDTTPPSVPANLTATAISSSQVNLSWSASTDNVGVAGYKIFRGGVAIATTSATSYSNTGLNPSTNYSYTVSAYDATGNNSAQSTAASATTFAAGDTTPPSVPTNLTATAVSQTQINLIWTASTDNVGVTGYKVFRGGTQIATSTTNSYSNVGLNPGTNYSYTVSAYDAAGNNSAQSTAASATTFSSPDTTPPSTPTGLTASPVSQTQINLTWTASTDNVGVVGYKVNRGGVQIATTSATSYSDAGLTASTLYTYNVSAYDAAGNNSGLSTSVSTTTLSSGVDTTPPSVSITAPTQGSSVAGSVAVMVTASDNVGVTKVEFYVNNALQSTDTVTPYAFSWGTVILANGSYTLSAKAYDAAGNIGISVNVSVNVSNTSGGGGGGAFGPLYTAPTDTGTHGYSPVVDALSGVQYAGAPPENTLAEDVDFTHNLLCPCDGAQSLGSDRKQLAIQ
jgi:chitodextrinase